MMTKETYFTFKNYISKRFWSSVESQVIDSKLRQVKAYAHQDITLSMEPGCIQADLIKDFQRAYKVKVGISILPNEQWNLILASLGRHSLTILDPLFQGIIEEDIDNALLLVTRLPFNHAITDCTCSGIHKFCEHVLWVCAKFAHLLEDDPFLLFSLRGMNKEVFLKKILSYKKNGTTRLYEEQVKEVPSFWQYVPSVQASPSPKAPHFNAAQIYLRGKFPFRIKSGLAEKFFETTYSLISEVAQKKYRNFMKKRGFDLPE